MNLEKVLIIGHFHRNLTIHGPQSSDPNLYYFKNSSKDKILVTENINNLPTSLLDIPVDAIVRSPITYQNSIIYSWNPDDFETQGNKVKVKVRGDEISDWWHEGHNTEIYVLGGVVVEGEVFWYFLGLAKEVNIDKDGNVVIEAWNIFNTKNFYSSSFVNFPAWVNWPGNYCSGKNVFEPYSEKRMVMSIEPNIAVSGYPTSALFVTQALKDENGYCNDGTTYYGIGGWGINNWVTEDDAINHEYVKYADDKFIGAIFAEGNGDSTSDPIPKILSLPENTTQDRFYHFVKSAFPFIIKNGKQGGYWTYFEILEKMNFREAIIAYLHINQTPIFKFSLEVESRNAGDVYLPFIDFAPDDTITGGDFPFWGKTQVETRKEKVKISTLTLEHTYDPYVADSELASVEYCSGITSYMYQIDSETLVAFNVGARKLKCGYEVPATSIDAIKLFLNKRTGHRIEFFPFHSNRQGETIMLKLPKDLIDSEDGSLINPTLFMSAWLGKPYGQVTVINTSIITLIGLGGIPFLYQLSDGSVVRKIEIDDNLVVKIEFWTGLDSV